MQGLTCPLLQPSLPICTFSSPPQHPPIAMPLSFRIAVVGDIAERPVQLQLECLGEEHVGNERLDFPKLNLGIVGGRPFSCGGDRLFLQKLLFARYGVLDTDQIAKRIYKVASATPDGYLIIVLAHNGPTGLGSDINDLCGKDWDARGGDHGDPDLAQAISDLKQPNNCCVPLVVFGHMPKNLAYEKSFRKMVAVGDDNTIYPNGAIVPRVLA